MDPTKFDDDSKPNTVSDGKFLTFKLENNDYGIPILKISEIIGVVEITPLPKAPVFMKGVINLRGKIIPVIDLRLKLGMDEIEHNQNTCIIIINLELKDSMKQLGLVVDIVSEVCNINQNDIEPAPTYGDETDNNFLSGIGKIKDKVIMLLDIEKIIFSDELLKIISDVH